MQMYERCISLRMILIGLGIKTRNPLKRTIRRPLDSRTRTTTNTIIELKIYLCIRHPGMLRNFFSRKDSTIPFIEGGYALSRSQNDKTSNI